MKTSELAERLCEYLRLNTTPEAIVSVIERCTERYGEDFPTSSAIDAESPRMEFETALEMLRLASKPDCSYLAWRPMPDHATGKYYDVRKLPIDELCRRLLPWFTQIGEWRKEARTQRERAIAAENERAKALKLVDEYYRELQMHGLRPWGDDDE